MEHMYDGFLQIYRSTTLDGHLGKLKSLGERLGH